MFTTMGILAEPIFPSAPDNDDKDNNDDSKSKAIKAETWDALPKGARDELTRNGYYREDD